MKMKVSDLKKIIKEEIDQAMQEMDYDPTADYNASRASREEEGARSVVEEVLRQMFPGLDVQEVNASAGMVEYYIPDLQTQPSVTEIQQRLEEKGVKAKKVLVSVENEEYGVKVEFNAVSPLMEKKKNKVVKKAGK